MSSSMIPGKQSCKLDMTEERLNSEAPYVSMNICELGWDKDRGRDKLRLSVCRQHVSIVQIRTLVTELEEALISCIHGLQAETPDHINEPQCRVLKGGVINGNADVRLDL